MGRQGEHKICLSEQYGERDVATICWRRGLLVLLNRGMVLQDFGLFDKEFSLFSYLESATPFC